VQSITWPGESVAEKDAGLAPEALFPALAYMGIGFGALYYSAILFAQSALLGHLALYYAALLFAMSGSIMGKFFILPKLIGQGETLSVRFLGFDIGKSAAGLWAGLALSTALTGVLFWTPSIATLFIGLSVAMALGTFSAFVAERKKI